MQKIADLRVQIVRKARTTCCRLQLQIRLWCHLAQAFIRVHLTRVIIQLNGSTPDIEMV